MDGDWELMPGVRGVLTLGHMPGHQSLVVELPRSGTKILVADVADVADAGDLRENFEREVPPGECDDPALGLASIRKLKAIRDATGASWCCCTTRTRCTHGPWRPLSTISAWLDALRSFCSR